MKKSFAIINADDNYEKEIFVKLHDFLKEHDELSSYDFCMAGLFKKNEDDLSSCEYLLPIFIGDILPEGKISVKVLETNDKWFGVTYKEDKPIVVSSLQKLIDDGVYSSDLFSDL